MDCSPTRRSGRRRTPWSPDHDVRRCATCDPGRPRAARAARLQHRDGVEGCSRTDASVLDHVRSHAGTLKVSSTRVGLIGVSTGGHLALLAAERGGASARIRAVVNVSGPTATDFIRRQGARPQLPVRTIRASFTNAIGCHPTACLRRWRAAGCAKGASGRGRRRSRRVPRRRLPVRSLADRGTIAAGADLVVPARRAALTATSSLSCVVWQRAWTRSCCARFATARRT